MNHNREFIKIYLQWEGVFGSNHFISGARPRCRGYWGVRGSSLTGKNMDNDRYQDPPLLQQLPVRRVENIQNVWLISQNLASWLLVQRATSKNSWQREKCRWWTEPQVGAWQGRNFYERGMLYVNAVAEVVLWPAWQKNGSGAALLALHPGDGPGPPWQAAAQTARHWQGWLQGQLFTPLIRWQ